VYRSEPQLVPFRGYKLLSEPCEVRFTYANEDAVEADVSSMETEEYLLFRWINGVWKIIEPSSS